MSKKTLIVCHDAGAAEVVSAWVKEQSGLAFEFIIEGPSREVFQRKLGKELPIIDLNAASARYESFSEVVTGTSWSSDLEKRALRWAKSEDIPTVTFLDHWINYRMRFETSEGLILPDELRVYDSEAKRIARKELNHDNIKIVENPYWKEMEQKISALVSSVSQGAPFNILYVTQPIADAAMKVTGDRNGYGYTEFSALEAFLEYIEPLQNARQIREFRVRLHPSEKPGKYESFFKDAMLGFNVSHSSSEELVKDIAWSNWVVGCDTMAMVIALKAHRRVSCSIPNGGRPLGIPLPGIERLFL